MNPKQRLTKPLTSRDREQYVHKLRTRADSHAWAVIAFGRYENNGRGIKGRTIKDKLPYLLDFVNEIEDLVKMPGPLSQFSERGGDGN